MTLGKKVFSQLFHTFPPTKHFWPLGTQNLWSQLLFSLLNKWNTPTKTDTENTPFANRTLKYRLNTKLAIFSWVLIKGHEKYRAIRPPATSTAICPTHAEGGERTWPCLREQGVLINMTRQGRNRGELLTDAKHISLFRSVPFADSSASPLFLHYLFSRVSALEWHPKQSLAGTYQLESSQEMSLVDSILTTPPLLG